MWRVRWVPSRSSSSVFGIAGGLRWGHGEHEHVGSVDGPGARQQPTRRDDVDRGADRIAAPAVGRDGDRLSASRSRVRRRASYRPRPSARARPRRRPVRRSPTRSPAPARPRSIAAGPARRARQTFGSVRCQPIEHNTPSSGATNAMSCHRAPISAAASTTPAQVATARVKGDACQRNSGFGAAGLDHARARGTGSRRNSSSTTSAPCTRRTHISGFRLIRCAMVGTASDFTSSGIT